VEKKVDLALDVAKRLEKYLTIAPIEEPIPESEQSGDQRNFDGEF
jgi:hypothetical protein